MDLISFFSNIRSYKNDGLKLKNIVSVAWIDRIEQLQKNHGQDYFSIIYLDSQSLKSKLEATKKGNIHSQRYRERATNSFENIQKPELIANCQKK